MSVGTQETAFDPASFSATVSSLTLSFGDSTRRKVFLFLRENPGATANELSDHCGVHANVVRHHLERLTTAGYVTYDNVKRPGVGRPAKAYRLLSDNVNMDGAVRRDSLLDALLEKALERLGPDDAESMALEVGQEYGRMISESMSPQESTRTMRNAMGSIAELLTAHGFAAHSETLDHESSSVVAESCPFGNLAEQHPVLCAVDRGLIAGMLEGLGAERTTVTLTSKARGDEACRATA